MPKQTLNEIAMKLRLADKRISKQQIIESDMFKEKFNSNSSTEIRSNKTPASEKTLDVDLYNGYILEVATAMALGYECNNSPHDGYNPNTFAYDLIGPNNEHIEIKSYPDIIGPQFRFNTGTATWEHKERAVSMKSFLKYTDYIDYLITATVDEKTGTIKFKFVNKAERFKHYVSTAEKPTAPSHWFHVKNSERALDTVIVNA